MTPHTKVKIGLILMAIILVFAIFDSTTVTVNASPEPKQRLPRGVKLTETWVSGGHKILVSTYYREGLYERSVSISTIHHPACPCGHGKGD